jgi:hypothetical protein
LVRAWSGHVEFMLDKVALGQVFPEYFVFPWQSSFPPNSPSSQSPGAGTTDQKWPNCRVDPVWTPAPTRRIKKKMGKTRVLVSSGWHGRRITTACLYWTASDTVRTQITSTAAEGLKIVLGRTMVVAMFIIMVIFQKIVTLLCTAVVDSVQRRNKFKLFSSSQ